MRKAWWIAAAALVAGLGFSLLVLWPREPAESPEPPIGSEMPSGGAPGFEIGEPIGEWIAPGSQVEPPLDGSSSPPPEDWVGAEAWPRPDSWGMDLSTAKVERHCTIEAPERVSQGRRLPVTVSLTQELLSPGTEIVSGERAAGGKLVFPAATVQVVLSAPAFDIREAMQPLAIPLLGDSDPILFELTARTIEGSELETRLSVSFWYLGARIASVVRRVTIQDAAAAEMELAPAPHVSQGRVDFQALPGGADRPPDLTLEVWSDEGRVGRANVTTASPYFQTPRHEAWELEDLQAWLQSHLPRSAGAGRGVAVAAASASEPTAPGLELSAWTGLGREAYRRLAPPAFQEMFWTLSERLGAEFDTIRIHTDLPWIPFELMRPSRADGSGERGFLGAEFHVGRWHLSERTALLECPPLRPRMAELVVIAPRYGGEQRLPSQDQELASLRGIARVREVPGQLGTLRQLFADLPQAVVHFAGHGVAEESSGDIHTYAILLEDGRLDLTTWLGFAPPRFASHPFFFLNSCDVGRSHRVANFVEGWAPAALELGACGTIGALWPIDDAGAAAFALEFYSRLYGQGPQRGCVAAALRESRQVFLDEGSPLGLAYVFYGDPSLTLEL